MKEPVHTLAQAGILAPLPALGRYLFFTLQQPQALPDTLRRLASAMDGERTVAGVGLPLAQALGAVPPGLRTMPALQGPQARVPSTPGALWCWLRGSDPGELWHRARHLARLAQPALHLERTLDAFVHAGGKDLSGFEDGTENPQGAAAAQAALVQGQGPGLDGASFVAVQQWLHDLDAFDAMDTPTQDYRIGRRRSDNEELDDAPASAHVKRTAQEDFDPPAFVLRRSMPWVRDTRAGLVFVAFGQSLDAFEAQLRRMLGLQDGITDGLFGFSQALTGAYFWCPPCRSGGGLDLRALGL